MRRALIFLLLSAPAFAQGTCSGFVAGVCPSNIPSGVTNFYFIDFASGSDSNSGATYLLPWKHAPGMTGASGNPAGHTPGTGEAWIFKGGVTVDHTAWPAQLPYGGSSGTPDYMGYDPGWFTGSAWARPIFSGGGSSGYNANGGSFFSDTTHNATNLTIDNIEFTGLYWNGTACSTNFATCGYITWHCDLSCTNSNINWEFKNLYAHNVTHSAWPNSTDPANTGALFWMPRDSGSSFHDSVIDNTDGGDDCCQGVYAANIYNDIFWGIDNVIFSPSSSSNAFNPFIFHDSVIQKMATSLYPQQVPPINAWQATHAFAIDSIITPSSNNPSGYTFSARVGGTTSGTQPNWNSSCGTPGNTCTDGGVTWYNGAPFQTSHAYAANVLINPTSNNSNNDWYNVTTAGTSGSQPNWGTTCPNIGQSCTDGGGVVWQNWTKTGQEPHGNCIHVFGNQSSSFNELIYNVYDQCDNANAETLLMEENSANIYAFNDVFVDITQPNGLSPSNFTSNGGTYNIFDNTLECGVDPTPANTCIRADNNPTVNLLNNLAFTNNNGDKTVDEHVDFGGTLTSAPTQSPAVSCSGGIGNPQANWGGYQFCAPTASLNFTEEFPFAINNSTDAGTVGTGNSIATLVSTITGLNAAAGAAAALDSTYGCGYNQSSHTVSCPARTPVARNLGTPQIGATQLSAPVFAGPALPTTWVDNNECTDGLAVTYPHWEFNLATQQWVTGPPTTCSSVTFNNPYWTVGTPTFSGLQQALTDMEACRTASGGSSGFFLDIPVNFAFTGTSLNGLVIPQTASTAASSCIVLRSTADSSLPQGQVVGAHGIQDNLAGSTDVLIRNPDATGTNMYFALGPSWSCASPPCSATNQATLTGITTVSVNTTTLCPIPNGSATTLCPATGSGVIQVPLANGYVSPTLGGTSSSVVTIDTGGNQETVTPASCPNQTGICATFTKTHSAGVCVVYNVVNGCGGITNGTGAFTLANGTATNVSAYNDVASLWTLQAQATGDAIVMDFCNASGDGALPACGSNLGPDHWLIEDMEARMYPGNTNNQSMVIINGVTTATSTAQMASHIHFDRDWLHCDWTSIAVGTCSVSAALQGEALNFSVTNSYISQMMRPGGEHHGIAIQGQGQKINHNVIESGSIPFFAGGYVTPNPSIPNYVPNCDTELRRNNGEWPFSWLGMSSPGNSIPAGYNPNFSTWQLLRKNGYENKSGCRMIVEGNVFGTLDNSGSQEGAAIALDVRNSSNGLGNANYQAILHDATVTNNVFRHMCSGPVFQNSAYLQGGGIAFQEQNVLFGNNLLYDQGSSNYQCSTNAGMEMSGTGGTWQGTVTILSDGLHASFQAICNVDDIQQATVGTVGGCPGQILASNVSFSGGSCSGSPTITFGTPNIAGGNHATGTMACSGTSFVMVKMTNYGTGYTGSATATVTCSACGSLPTVTVTPLTLSNYVPVSSSTGFEVFDIVPGQPVPITQCQNSALNTVGTTLYQTNTYLPSAVGPGATTGSALWSGSFNTAGVTVTFPLTGTPGTTDTTGYCKLTTIQGGPGNNIQWQHNTVVSNVLHQITAGNGINNIMSDGPNFQTQALLQNSIFVGGTDGWCNNPIGCGNPTIAFDFDTVNSATIDHLVWPGPGLVSTPYTAFGNNPLFPVASPVMYFPTDSYCTGASPTSACVGFIGAMSASSMPLNLPDYHNFGLIAGSSFKAGGTDQASDGTDMGPNIANIDTAQTLNLFVCGYTCGSPGPYPDTVQVIPPVTPTSFTPSKKFLIVDSKIGEKNEQAR